MARVGVWVVGALAVSTVALAARQDPEGARRTLAFTVVYRTTGASTLDHVLKGSCTMEVGAPSAVGLGDRPASAANQAATRAATAAMTGLEAEMKKCGKDQACLMALAMRMSEDGSLDAAADAADRAATTDAHYVVWYPSACTGTLAVNDTVTSTGVDATGSYTSTTTYAGSGPLERWDAVFLEHDTTARTTAYRFAPTPGLSVATTTVVTGVGARRAAGRELVSAFPEVPAPTSPGAPQSGKSVQQVPGGSVTFTWTITR